MIGLDSQARIWLCTEPTDMRKSFRGLSALVRNQLKHDPLSGQYFVFVNRRKTQMKMLYFTGDEKQKAEIIAAPQDINIEIERGRVIDWFNSEEQSKLAEIEEIRSKRQYFQRYFGSVMADVPQQIEA